MSLMTTDMERNAGPVCLQRQSRLFQLPRELRDRIYEYYAHEENGYLYDFTTATMRCNTTASNISPEAAQPIQLGLTYSCKMAADELRGVALRVNTLTFVTGEADGESECRGVRSKAGRLRCLLFYLQRTRLRLLLSTADLVTPQILDQIEARYPTAGDYIRQKLQTARDTPLEDRRWLPTGDFDREGITLVSFDHALEYALELLRTENVDRFDEFALQALSNEGGGVKSRLARCFFNDEALYELLAWKVVPWNIPSEEDLIRAENLLIKPECGEGTRDLNARVSWLHNPTMSARWFFSAAAIAIDFLRCLPKPLRLCIRQVILKEDRKSVAKPSSHAQGLVPFFKENAKLRVERHIGMRANLLPVGWRGIDSQISSILAVYSGGIILRVIPEWLENTRILSATDLPKDAFTLVLEGQSPEGIHCWNVMKHAASLQGAMLECFRRKGLPIHPMVFSSGFYMGWKPCDLPSSFAAMVRNIMRGDGLVRFDGSTGETWDVEELVQLRQDWTLGKWTYEWRKEISESIHPTDIFQTLPERYRIQQAGSTASDH